MLEENVSDHRHQRMTVQTLPGSSLEVVKTEFLFVEAGLKVGRSQLNTGIDQATRGLEEGHSPSGCARS
jgi:hypothetical protein